MRLLLDINILLDLAFQRPGAPASAAVIAACGRQHQGWLAWHTLATLAYLIERQGSAQVARAFIGLLQSFLSAGVRHTRRRSHRPRGGLMKTPVCPCGAGARGSIYL